MERINLEINAQNLQALAVRLQETLSPDTQVRKDAEKFLETIEGNSNYSLLLLHIVDNASFSDVVRLASSITFKNFVKRHWRVIENNGPNKITHEDRESIKSLIIDLMLKSPPQLQSQLSDAVSIIGREDFPRKWTNLLPDMVKKFRSGDFHIINGVLKTAHSLFKRYRHEFKSQELWQEIKIVLDGFAEPLTELLKATMELANKHGSDPASLKILFSSLTLISKVFYSLNSQDLPAYFEDNMEEWMKHFLVILTTDNKLLQTEDDEAGPLELIKSQICDNLALYAQKYDEEFQPYLPGFVDAIWNLLTTIEPNAKYDLLVSNAIQFLTSVCERPHYKNLFENENNLQSICEKVIVPNMQFRDTDEEEFEDNPEEYIRRDIEGSDVDTRRRAACDFVRGLCKYFEQPVTAIFSQYVTMLLQNHAKDPAVNWKSKDCAIYLVTSLATKKQTAKHGTTQASELVSLTDFFNTQILPELKNENVDATPVLKADALKYVTTFRSMLSRDILLGTLPLLVNMLKAKSVVVHTYAAYTIERIFTLKMPGGGAPITRAEVKPFVEQLLTNLFHAFEITGSHENEYIMKAIMRTFALMQEEMAPYMGVLLKQLIAKLTVVSKGLMTSVIFPVSPRRDSNPSKPQFNHYLFETLSCAVRYTCKTSNLLGEFENYLFPIFTEIIQRDVTEFLPYVFQVLSLLLELRKDGLPQSHLALYPFLLSAAPWERQGNIPPMVRLLQSYINKAPAMVTEDHKLGGLLGVFQKLVASKTNDHEGFYILNTLVENVEQAKLAPHLQQIFILLFQRLSSSKTTKYVKGLLVFLSLYASKYGAPHMVEIIDSLQKKLFGMVVEKLYIADVQKVSGHTERKICAIGITHILTNCPVMLADYNNYWAPLLSALIGLFELPEDTSTPDDEHFIEIEDTPGYQAAYCQLAFAGSTDHDPFVSVPDAKVFLAKCLNQLSTNHPGKITAMIKSSLSSDVLTCLQKYLTGAGVTLT